jgi:hypothetical protein
MLRQLILRLLDWLAPEPEPKPPTNAEVALAKASQYIGPGEEVYTRVAKADAIAELCIPTGDPMQDGTHVAVIDLIQDGLVDCVRDSQGRLRYTVTPLGKAKIQEILAELGGSDGNESARPGE